MKRVIIKIENRAFDVRMEYSRKAFGQKFIYRSKKLQINASKYKKGHILYRRESNNYRNEKTKSDLVIFNT